MYANEFSRLKSQFLNNISSAYMALGDYDKADQFNNDAMMQDPDYLTSFLIRCHIYTDTCQYERGLNMAKWAAEKCDLDLDEEADLHDQL